MNPKKRELVKVPLELHAEASMYAPQPRLHPAPALLNGRMDVVAVPNDRRCHQPEYVPRHREVEKVHQPHINLSSIAPQVELGLRLFGGAFSPNGGIPVEA
jgi:hypothetical protein